jgi:hypothetical protein
MPSWATRNEGSLRTSRPANLIEPARAGVSPMMERMVVVLPMPLRPMIATISLGATVTLRPCSTSL